MTRVLRMTSFEQRDIKFETPIKVKDQNGIEREIDEIYIKAVNKSGKTVECLYRNKNMNYFTKNIRISYVNETIFVKLNGINYKIGTFEEV